MSVLRPGQLLRGKYRIERALGSGGMAHVYLATHMRLGRKVAVKMLAPSAMKAPNALLRFAQEARAAACLRSEHVVRILDVDDAEDGAPFLVMEHLEGRDLDRRLRAEVRFPLEQAVDYVLQACAGLAEAHAAGIVHRDLKPANLFLATTRQGPIIKLLDFGIAKAIEDRVDGSVTLTDASTVVGSPCFMSPEQLRGSKTLDARSDIWSLGVILYQLVSGELPFEGNTATALAARISADPPAPLRLDPLPEGFEEVLARFLEKDPTKRFENVLDVARALAPFGGPHAKERVERVEKDGEVRHESEEKPVLPLSDNDLPAATMLVPDGHAEFGIYTPPERGGDTSKTALQETLPAEPSGVGVIPDSLSGDAPPAHRTDYSSSLPPAPEPTRARWAAIGATAVVVAAATFFLTRAHEGSAPVASPSALTPSAAQSVRAADDASVPTTSAASAATSVAPSAVPSAAPIAAPSATTTSSARPSVKKPAHKDPLDIDLK